MHPHPFRSWLRGLEPRVLQTLNGPLLGRLRPWLDGHDVFSFTREPLARGVAIGILCGLIPGPLQVLGSIGMCAWLRGNIIAAVIATAYTNPLTIVPLYWLAFQIGAAILPGTHVMPHLDMHHESFTQWASGMVEWMMALGWPLLLGLPILGVVLAASMYGLVQLMFLLPVWRRARRMRAQLA
jgi:uncharacterized protein